MKKKLAKIYLGRREHNWVIEDVEIGFPPPGDTGSHDTSCMYIL
jgi:hypothetical protein